MRSQGRHMPYFGFLDALGMPGCAVCRRGDVAAESHLRNVLAELVNDGETRESLKESGGYCHEHAWRLVAHRDQLGIAILYRDQVRRLLGDLDAARAGRTGGEPHPGHVLCPACKTRQQAEAAALTLLVEHLAEEDFRAALVDSDGLCREHIQRAALKARDKAGMLVELEESILKRLLAELDELIRKHDYRFQREPIGRERSAWWRAVATIAGLDVRRLPSKSR